MDLFEKRDKFHDAKKYISKGLYLYFLKIAITKILRLNQFHRGAHCRMVGFFMYAVFKKIGKKLGNI